MALHTNSIRLCSNRAPLLMMAHGFTQNSRCWGCFGSDLARHLRLDLIDLPGHGQSLHDTVDFTQAANLLSEASSARIALGYSMGGRMLLKASLAQPERFDGIILIGVNPGIEQDWKRNHRRQQDDKLADDVIDMGVVAFVQRWLKKPLFAEISATEAAAKHRYRNRPEGLAASLRLRSVGCQVSLWPQLSTLRVPTLLMAGRSDTAYVSVNNRMAAEMLRASAVELDGGHAVHLQSPRVAAETVVAFVEQLSGCRSVD